MLRSLRFQSPDHASVLSAQPIQLGAPGVGRGVKTSALFSLPVDNIVLPLAHGHNKHQHFAIQHSETLARSQRIQNELIARGTTIFSSRREAGDRIRTGDVQLGKLTFYH